MNYKEILQKNSFAFNKRFGQNFISDENFLASLVEASGIDNNTNVLEIGVGAGSLTAQLLKRCKYLIGYEIDRRLETVLDATLSEYTNFKIVFGDFMRCDLSKLEQDFNDSYTVVANLPYYITTPIIWRFIEEAQNVKSLVVMVQEEVAERMIAKENTPEYGAITASIDVEADCSIIKHVNRTVFYPVPNVDSAVLKIDIKRNKYEVDVPFYRKVVKSAFLNRRKTLLNNLSMFFGLDKTITAQIMAESGVDVACRGETLSTEAFVKLANVLKNSIKNI